MINKKSLNKGSIYLIANVLNASIPFLLLPVLTRVLSPEDYGIVAMFTIFLTLTNAFVGLSVQGAINVNYFNLTSQKFSEYIASCLVLLILSTLITFIVIAIFGFWIERYVSLPYHWLLIAVAVSFFQFLIRLQLTVWIVKGAAIQYGGFQISNTLINTLFSLFLIFAVGMLWEGRLIGQAVAIIGFGIVSILLLYKNNLIKKPTTLKLDMQDALKFGLPLIPHVLGAFAIYSMDRVIITTLIGAYAVGIYMVGLQLGQAMGLLSDSFNKVYSPWLMKTLSTDEIDKQNIVKNSYLAMGAILFVGLLWGIVATVALPILAGEKFRQAQEIIWLLCLGFSFQGLYYLVTNYIFYTKKTKFLAVITFLSGIINLPLTYFFVKHYGIVGAAYAFILVQFLFFVSVWYLSNKVYPMPWFYFFKGKRNA
ncbi:lipopolysaccharide biosynthesis protein [Acinetobacter radioresistens]|uniref:lipopolysaccharide biosynthesis protein n=1 Tax=Acinetobacter radioresistens TaxID=40216 RepID=UPI00157B0E7B|nr:oligosaccharide flippase family protein [Acinetobacter radioresistens]